MPLDVSEDEQEKELEKEKAREKEKEEIKLALEKTASELEELKLRNKEIIDLQSITQEKVHAFEIAMAEPKENEGLEDKFDSLFEDKLDLVFDEKLNSAFDEKLDSAFDTKLDSVFDEKLDSTLVDKFDSINNNHEALSKDLNLIKENFENQRLELEELKKTLEEVGNKEPEGKNERNKENEARLEELSILSNKLLEDVTKNEEVIRDLEDYKNELSGINHLSDIDKMWDLIKNQNNILQNFREEYEAEKAIAQDEEIGEGPDQEILIEKIDGIQNSIQQNDVYTKARLTNVEETTRLELQSFEKKLQNAYIFGGIAVLIVIIQFIVIFFNMV